MNRDHLKYIQALVKADVRKQRKSIEKANRDHKPARHLRNLINSLHFRLDALHAVDAAYMEGRGQADFTSEWYDAARGAARQFIQEKVNVVVTNEEAYANLLDDITAEYAVGIRIDPTSSSPALDRFVRAVDSALEEAGHPHPYERSL